MSRGPCGAQAESERKQKARSGQRKAALWQNQAGEEHLNRE